MTRNRVRRRLRAAVRAHRARLAPGASYLFGASRGAEKLTYREIERATGQLLQRSAVPSTGDPASAGSHR